MAKTGVLTPGNRTVLAELGGDQGLCGRETHQNGCVKVMIGIQVVAYGFELLCGGHNALGKTKMIIESQACTCTVSKFRMYMHMHLDRVG